ncbi:MAG: hypothetical protein ACP5FZ_10600 [Fidelibacterota bacterium]
MGCHKEKKESILCADQRDYRLLALDDCVFCTLISFPVNDDDIADMMWEQLCLNNTVNTDDKDLLKSALLEFYRAHKDEYSIMSSECSGCSECG